MADSREFTLIGSFQDDITPKLNKLNTQLNSLKTSLGNMGGKGARNTSRDMGRLAVSISSFTDNLKEQNTTLRASVAPLREFRQEIWRTVNAYKQLNMAGGNARGLQATNKALAAQLQLMRQANALRSGSPRPTRAYSGTGGGGGGRSGGGGGRIADSDFEKFGFELKLANSISDAISTGVMKGFQIGTDLMKQPFEWFIGAFQERVGDQISDLKAAGGLYSISKRSKNPFLRDIDDAIQFQQDTNETFAKMAGALPGVTNDYVQAGKRLSDTAARIVEKDFAGALKIAQGIRATEEGRRFYGGEITGTPAEQRKEVIKTILGDLTKTTTLAGMGGRTGAGGVSGAYGLPGIVERILNEDQVSMGKFQRYASVFGDPAIADALTRNIELINKTTASGPERLEAVRKMMSEIVTDELIEKLRISVDGIYQGLKSAIMDPDSGLFGLSRQFKGIGKKLNSYGQYVDEMGKAVDDVNKAASADLGLFEILSDIFSNLGQSLGPFIENIKLVFDPLRKIGDSLMDARHYAAQFNKTFNQYREGLKLMAKESGKGFLNDTLDIRASFAAIANLLKQFNVIGTGEFKTLMKMIGSKDLDIGAMMKTLIDKVLNSDIAGKIGETIGSIVGTVISEVAGVTGFVAGRLKSSNKLFDGLRKGFDAAGGAAAMANIFKDVWGILLKLAWTVVTKAPLEVGAFAAITLVVPAVAQLIGWKIATALWRTASGIGVGSLSQQILGAAGGAARVTGSAAAAGAARRGGLASAFMAPGAYQHAMKVRAPFAQGAGKLAAFGKDAFSGLTKALAASKFGKAMTKVARWVPGGAVATGVLDAGIRMMSGESAARAIGGAGASAGGASLGAYLGTLALPGVGTAIGGVAGAILGDSLYNLLVPETVKQEEAAKKQIAAADLQMAAARERGEKKTGIDLGAAETFVQSPEKLYQALVLQGRENDPIAKELLQAAGDLKQIRPIVDEGEKKLNAAIQSFIKPVSEGGLGYSREQANKQPEVIAARAELAAALKKEAERTKKVQELFSKLPPEITKSLVGVVAKTDDKAITAAFVAKVNSIAVPSNVNYDWTNIAPGIPKPQGPSSIYVPPKGGGWVFGNPFASAGGSLGDAIRSEIKNKPSGSDLVIANSSETVIPAAGGHGMLDIVETFRSGFIAVVNTYKQAQQKQDETLNKINSTLVSNQKETNARLAKLETKFASPGMPGGLGGASAGGVDAFTGIAQRYGLTMTSAFRPGDPGYHGANRARDYSNGTGPTPQMMQFAQFMAQNYGKNLKELIYTPLGYSIKNGQIVSPYAQSGHYNHVHVAYAMGMGNPILASGKLAQQIDEKALGKANVKTYTAGKGEFGGGTVVNVGGVVVYADGISDPDKVAYMVAQKIGQAVTAAESGALTLNYY